LIIGPVFVGNRGLEMKEKSRGPVMEKGGGLKTESFKRPINSWGSSERREGEKEKSVKRLRKKPKGTTIEKGQGEWNFQTERLKKKHEGNWEVSDTERLQGRSWLLGPSGGPGRKKISKERQKETETYESGALA